MLRLQSDSDSKEMKNMYKYFALLKTNPTKNEEVRRTLKNLPEQPYHGVRMFYTMNCFGTWNLALWFEAEDKKYANEFIQNKIRPIQGILEAYTVPTTPIREYINWK